MLPVIPPLKLVNMTFPSTSMLPALRSHSSLLMALTVVDMSTSLGVVIASLRVVSPHPMTVRSSPLFRPEDGTYGKNGSSLSRIIGTESGADSLSITMLKSLSTFSYREE